MDSVAAAPASRGLRLAHRRADRREACSGRRSGRLQPVQLLRRGDALLAQHTRPRQVIRGPRAIRFRGADLGGAGGGRFGKRPSLLDQCGEPGLVQHGDGIAGAHGVTFVFEEPGEPAGGQWAEPHFANLDGAGDGERVAGTRARRGPQDGGER